MTRLFLQDLLIPGQIPHVPREVKEQARGLLRHYPTDFDLWRACQDAPSVFQEEIEPVARMILQHKQDIEQEQND
jgi:hypothetical protein